MPRFSADIWFEGDDFLDNLSADIKKAEKSVHAAVYILKDDDTGRMFTDLLAEKSREGLDVRLMTDGIGSWNLGTASLERLRKNIKQFHVFEPVSVLSFFSMSVNRRNHMKLFIIDEKIVYIGGMNIKNAVSRRFSGENRWIDCMMRIRDDEICVSGAVEIFERAWARFYHGIRRPVIKGVRQFGSHIARIRAFRKDEKLKCLFFDNIGLIQRLIHRRIFLQTVRSARKSLYIETPYFVPGIPLLAAVRRAARRGADVRILLNSVSDVEAAKWAGRAVYAALLKKGVRIRERQGAFSHAKVLTCDGTTGIIGSSNLDYRSFFHNYEVDFLFQDHNCVSGIDSRFSREWEEAREISLAEWRKRPLTEKITEYFWFSLRWFL